MLREYRALANIPERPRRIRPIIDMPDNLIPLQNGDRGFTPDPAPFDDWLGDLPRDSIVGIHFLNKKDQMALFFGLGTVQIVQDPFYYINVPFYKYYLYKVLGFPTSPDYRTYPGIKA